MTVRRPFRFGVVVNETTSLSQLQHDARRFESLGYSTALLPDHLAGYTPLSPLPAAVAIASVTQRLRVGTLVLNNEFRHPVQVARDAATVDLLTDGRFELGLGAGWLTSDFDQAGLERASAATRVARLRESATIVKQLLEGGTVDFEGEHYRVAGLEGRPKTMQRPRPPVLIGGGSRTVLELAAREADIVGIVPPFTGATGGPVAAMAPRWESAAVSTDRQIEWIRGAAGHRIDELEIQSFTMMVVVTPARADAAAQLAPNLGISNDAVLESTVALVGTVDEIADDLVARRDRWGISYVVVPQLFSDAFAPVIGRLAGT